LKNRTLLSVDMVLCLCVHNFEVKYLRNQGVRGSVTIGSL